MDPWVSLYQSNMDSYYGNKQIKKFKAMHLPYSHHMASMLCVHSALFLALLHPHSYFCLSLPISVDAKFSYFDSLYKLLQTLNISTQFPLFFLSLFVFRERERERIIMHACVCVCVCMCTSQEGAKVVVGRGMGVEERIPAGPELLAQSPMPDVGFDPTTLKS